MTLKELSRLYYLNKLISRDTARMKELDGMCETEPKMKQTLNELKAHITEERRQYIGQQRILEAYINGIDDYLTRIIMLSRFVDLKTWNEIAAFVGGNNTEDSVKKICYRFIRTAK